MKKKILLGVALLAILTGCGEQPELDVNVDQNKTVVKTQPVTQPQVEQNQTATEEDLTDTTAVKVTDESSDINDNQKLAEILSKNVVHFDFDKYNIRPDQMPIVKAVADILKDMKGNYTVRIEGNCDEWGSDEYNYALGLKRAKAVKNALVNLGVDADKLTIISYGESNPVCIAHTKECWAKNRRDDFTLLP
jgi:peptidoglycan-associated lipoprotein